MIKNKMNNEEETESTLMVNDAICSMGQASMDRRNLLEFMGSQLNTESSSDLQKYYNGHRGLIGFCYKTIRGNCGLSLNEIAAKCFLSEEKMKEGEDTGFLSVWQDGCSETSDWSFIKQIYTGHLNFIIYDDAAVFTKITPIEMNNLIYTVKSEMEEEAYFYTWHYRSDIVERSLKNIKRAYSYLGDFLEPCAWE